MKGLILLANHFEDVEALITIDMLRRAGITIDMVSMNNDLNVITQSNIAIKADILVSSINLDDYSFLVIPGGKATFETHHKSVVTKNIVKHFYDKNQLVASICAAPSILGMMGLLDGIEYTCFPGCESYMPNAIYKNQDVVVSKNIITSKAAGTTFKFAYEIIKYLTNEELAKKVINSVYYK